MDFYDCERPSTDYVDLSETEWNLPHLVPPPPRKTLTSVYGNNAPFFPHYSRNIYPYRPKRHREIYPLIHKQFSQKEIISRRPYPSHDWNFPVKNVPNHYNASMIPLTCSPYNPRSRFNSPYTQSNDDEFHLQNYSSELIFPNNPGRMQNVLYRESEYPEMQNFGNFNVPQDVWDSSIVQTSCDPSYNRKIPTTRPSLQSSGHLGNVCEEAAPIKDTEIPCITYPQQSSNSTEPVISSPSPNIQAVSDNSTNTGKVTETNSSLNNTPEQNIMENDVHPKALENSLDYLDETALSVYFLNDLYLNSQTDGNNFDLPSNSQNVPPDSNNNYIFDETTVNNLVHENIFDQIGDLELEIASTNKELDNVNGANLAKNFENKSVPEIGGAQVEENIGQANATNAESSGYSTENIHENCFGSKCNDSLHISTQSLNENNEHSIITENLSINSLTEVGDLSSKESTDMIKLGESNLEAPNSSLQNCSESKQGKNDNFSKETIKNKTRVSNKRKLRASRNNFDNKVNKYTAEQKIIFHAPIININHQNQMPTSFNDKKLLDGIDRKLYHNLGNDIMKLLSSLQNNASVGQTNPNGKSAEQDPCLSARDNPRNSDNTQMNSGVLNSAIKSKDSTFVYSNVLETLPNHIETTLSSVTNYIVDEPMNDGINHCDIAFESGSIKHSPVVLKNLEENSESAKKSIRKGKRNSMKKKTYSNEIRLSAQETPYSASENTINPSMEFLDNIFQSESSGHSTTFQAAPKDTLENTKYKRKKINWKKWKHISKRLVQVKPQSGSCLPKLYYNKIKSTRSGGKIEALNQNSNKLYREAFTQTSEADSDTLSVVPISKQDAQTQWDIPEIKETSESSEHEEMGNKAGESLCKQEGTIKCKKEVEFKSEKAKYNWNLRPRRLESSPRSVSCSEIKAKSEANFKNTNYNSPSILETKTRLNRNKNTPCSKKKPSETGTRSFTSKVDGISEKNQTETCKKTTTENLSYGNRQKFHKSTLRNSRNKQKVSTRAICNDKTAKTSKPKRNNKKK